MGCYLCNADTQQPKALNYKPDFMVNVTPALRSKLLTLLALDDCCQIAALFDQEELSPLANSGTKDFQTIGMSCVKARASRCLRVWLSYLAYNHSSIYGKAVNLVTNKFQTMLIFTAKYLSRECFDVLFEFGGISIAHRDRKGRTVLACLYDLQCQDFALQIQKIAQKGLNMIPLGLAFQPQKPIFNVTQAKIRQVLKQNRAQFDSIMIAQGLAETSDKYKRRLQIFTLQMEELEAKYRKQQEQEQVWREQIKLKKSLMEEVMDINLLFDGEEQSDCFQILSHSQSSKQVLTFTIEQTSRLLVCKAIQADDQVALAEALKQQFLRASFMAGDALTAPMLCCRFAAANCLRFVLVLYCVKMGKKVLSQVFDVLTQTGHDIFYFVQRYDKQDRLLQLLFQFGGFKIQKCLKGLLKDKSYTLANSLKIDLCLIKERYPLTQKEFTVLDLPVLSQRQASKLLLNLVNLRSDQSRVLAQQQPSFDCTEIQSKLKKTKQLKQQTKQPPPSKKDFTFDQVDLSQYPQNLRKIMQNCISQKKQYEDSKFLPRNIQLVFGVQDFSIKLENIDWKRPIDIFGKDVQLFGELTLMGTKQNSRQMPFLLPVLVSISQKHSQRIYRLFNTQVFNPVGLYSINLFIQGEKKQILIDDNFPVCKGINLPMFHQPHKNQIWSMLVQKALAKYCQSYLNANGMTAQYILEELLACPTQNIYTTHYKHAEVMDILREAIETRSIVLATTAKLSEGSKVADYTFIIKRLVVSEGRQLIQVCNFWNQISFKGQFSRDSGRVSPELRNLLGRIQDGNYLITIEEYMAIMDSTTICHCSKEYSMCTIPFTSNRKKPVFFKLELKEPDKISLRLSQPFDRTINDRRYSYAKVLIQTQHNGRLILRRVDKSRSSTIGRRAFQQLEKGQYTIKVEVDWPNEQKYNRGSMILLSPSPLNFQRLQR